MPRVVKRMPVMLLTTSLTISGRLRCVNIEKSDAKGGKAYACHTINYFINYFRSSEVCEQREG